MNRKLTILVADDHSILRAGLASILNNQPNMEVIGEAEDGMDALQKAIVLKPNLLLTDISMPKMNGTETISEIKKRNPGIKILVLTMHSDEENVHAALNSGADGYVLKDDSHNELLAAITNVLDGKMHLSPSICGNVINGYLNTSNTSSTPKPISSYEHLTHREREVIKLIAEGYRSKDIAMFLSISIKTVEKHRSNLMRKLDLHNISSLTNYAIKNGLSIQN
jgi:DNA-binding NarL/FixJ family response regulator